MMLLFAVEIVLIIVSLIAASYNSVVYFRDKKTSPTAMIIVMFCAITVMIITFVVVTERS